MVDPITREELKQRIDAGEVTLVEALPAQYFESGHLPGALNINHDEVRAKASALLPDKHALIVTYCASTTCQNSTAAARQLEALGYTNVREYVEGKSDWQEAGLPLETSAVTA